ncbi:MAG: hypothetical protein Q4G26_14950 [Paracoccus sp. (in: a-proteobacteria)]|nr:hypothetical protein [Paracoccus sp. (in: a-proteobacteria)]
MSTALRAFLILTLLLTAQGLAVARGQARIAGEIVLCAGGEMITVLVDENGQPVKRMVICPDMALSLMSGVVPAPVLIARPDSPLILPWTVTQAHAGSRPAPLAQARDPPPFPTV